MPTSAGCSTTWFRCITVCDLASRNYPQVNRDLLLTGAFLHDIGKIHELSYQRSISYTTKGQLLGHMIIELEMLHEKLAQIPGFPDELKILIEHLIISHHGQYEFGSPKLPMFPEALMLHYLDDLDSKMESMRAQFERESELETPWTSYNPSLGRPLLNSQKFLEKGGSAACAIGSAKSRLRKRCFAEAGERRWQSDAATGSGCWLWSPTIELPTCRLIDALQRKFASHKVTHRQAPRTSSNCVLPQQQVARCSIFRNSNICRSTATERSSTGSPASSDTCARC